MRSVLTRLVVVWVLLWAVPAGWAATSPIYINNSPMYSPPNVAPQIDATVFVNRSVFSVDQNQIVYSGTGIIGIPNTLPYETYNTLIFTNTGSGVLFGDPGYRFNYAHDNDQSPMDWWVNLGSVDCDSTYYYDSSGNSSTWLLVDSTHIVNRSLLNVGSQGLLRLEGTDIDLKRSGIRAGPSLTNAGILFVSTVLDPVYVNDVGIFDVYWGLGTNNVLSGGGTDMRLTGFGGGNSLGYTLPFPQSPTHQTLEDFSGFTFTNITSLPNFLGFGQEYTAAVYTNQINPTNFSIQVVFFPTNTFDTNYSREVRFFPDFTDDGATVVVAFHNTDFDIVNQTTYTNSIYLVDALAYETNVFFARNLDTTRTRRPDTYEITRNQPYFFDSFSSVTSNAAYDPLLIYNPATYASNTVRTFYTAYQVQISSLNTIDGSTVSGFYASPTNLPGRVEILGDKVNMEQTRVRADSTLILRAGDLTSNKLAQVDAPFVAFDVGSTQPLLLISNIAPPYVRRLNGTISAWSGIWRNYETNTATSNFNTIDFHVLIVDDSLQSLQPVTLTEFLVRATNVNIADNISVSEVMRLDLSSLDLIGSLQLPYGASWAATNVLNLLNFTNRGFLSIDGTAEFGTDRPDPYENFVNEGTVSSDSVFLRTRRFDNSGAIVANGGLLSVDALQARLMGPPTVIVTNVFTNIFLGFTNIFTNIFTNSFGAQLAANSDIQISAQDLVVSNSLIQAGISLPGGLRLSMTNRLTDSGPDALNEWETTAGMAVNIKPAVSDLRGTQIRSVATTFAEVFHTWPGDDLGVSTNGYQNNMALGKLILDAHSSLSLLRFAPADWRKNQALYVDYLFFHDYATNYTETLLVEPGMTLYFADSNIPAEKLDGALGGRLRWVRDYTGAFSSTNLTYPSGRTYTFNHALVVSKDLDSDRDGIPNAFDPTPIFVADDLKIIRTKELPSIVLLSWTALDETTNHVEFRDTLDATAPWQELTVLVTNPTMTVYVQDILAGGVTQRFYRVRIDPFD